jgi:hypothetical protein
MSHIEVSLVDPIVAPVFGAPHVPRLSVPHGSPARQHRRHVPLAVASTVPRHALGGEDIGLEEIDDGIWNIVYYRTLLGKIDERTARITGITPGI